MRQDDIRESGLSDYWGNRSNTYGKQYGLDTKATQIKIKRKVALIDELSGFSKMNDVLEMGCGTGLYTRELHKLNNRLVSSDISESMIKEAKELNPNVPFKCVDARKTNFCGCSFDAVISAYLLQHVNTIRCLLEMRRILKIGGKLIVLVPNILNPIHYARARVGIARWFLKETSNSEDFNRLGWNIFMSDLKFKNIITKPIEFTSPYTPERLMNISMWVGKVLESVPLVREFAGTLLIVATKDSK